MVMMMTLLHFKNTFHEVTRFLALAVIVVVVVVVAVTDVGLRRTPVRRQGCGSYLYSSSSPM